MPLQFPPWDMLTTISLFNETTVVVGTNATLLIPKDSKRWLIVFGMASSGSSVNVSTNPAATTAKGIITTGQVSPLVLTLDQWGPFVTQDWYGVSGIGGVNMTVFTASVLQWPTGLTPGVVLPAQAVADQQSQRQADREQRASRALRNILQKNGITIPAWLASNGSNNGS